MTLSRVETMHGILGPRKEINITYKDPVETYQTGRGALGTTEPATPTFSYTLSATTHLASVDKPIIYSNLAILHVGGQNLTALSQYINYRVYKNSTEIIATGTQTVTASQYWTLRLTDADLVGVLAGDVIDVMLWSTNADALEWQYDAIGCMITRIKPFNDSRKILFNVTYNGVSYPVFTSGLSPSPASTQYGYYYGCINATSLPQSSSNQVVYAQSENSKYGIYRLGFGDYSPPTKISNSATKMPSYAQNLGVPTKIIYNELLL